MQADFLKFLKALFIYSIVSVILYFLLIHFTLNTKMQLPQPWALFGFMFLLTAVFHGGLLYIGRDDAKAFIRFYMGASIFKILLFVVIFVFAGFLNPTMLKAFAVHFFLLYILFTSFEVMYLQKNYGSSPKKS